jgi:hypothetical protein
VGGVIIEDNADDLAGRNVGFDRIEKTNELLVAVTLHAAADGLASSTLSAANKVVVPCRF